MNGGIGSMRFAVVTLCIICFSGAVEARVVNLVGRLDGSQAANGAGTGSAATGSVVASLETDTLLFSWTAQYGGLSSAITTVHFHGPALPGVSAPPTIVLSVANPETGSQVITQGQAIDLQNGLWYINVHTSMFPGDEIRGQLSVIPMSVTTIGNWGLFALVLGLLALGTLRLRRRV